MIFMCELWLSYWHMLVVLSVTLLYMHKILMMIVEVSGGTFALMPRCFLIAFNSVLLSYTTGLL